MKLEDQVLSIKQVQELKKLGFDVEKYASMCWLEQSPFLPDEEPVKYELEILTDSLIGNKGSLDVIPTLTIGDIIGILQERIQKKYYLEINKNNGKIQEKLIDKLFEILKLCIKLNKIAL